jgi:hypothetical protein
MVKIEDGKAEYIIPEIYDYLKEKRQPVYLSILGGRYLFFHLLDPSYVTPNVAFDSEVIPESYITFKGAADAVDNVTFNVCKAINAVNSQQQGMFLYNTYGTINL